LRECKYRAYMKAMKRQHLDLSREAKYDTLVMWYCTHPFHGITIELGDGSIEVEKKCAACTLIQKEKA
jgi:hypothetical protein